MGKRLKPTINSEKSPFNPDFGNKVGAGQDNFVREFKGDKAAKFVVKISKQKGLEHETPERAKASTLYKKKKYEILKLFLGDFIPKSHFIVGKKTEGRREPVTVPKSYTVQERVPNIRIADLPEDKKLDPRLLRQMYVLVRKLQNMYLALNEVNDVVSNTALDGKLDLGGVSKYVENEYNPRDFKAADIITRFQKSPNLLIDPETMRLYCVDFDDGTWDDEKEAAKGVLEHIANNSQEVQSIIAMDPNILPFPPKDGTNGVTKIVA